MFDFSFEFLSVVEEAAIASARSMGLDDAETSDRLAVEKMRAAMDLIPMHGTIVIGEGRARRGADALHRREGRHRARARRRPPRGFPQVDIAVDPLEGTNLCATGAGQRDRRARRVRARRPAARARSLHGEARRRTAARGAVDLDAPVADNLKAIARCLGAAVDDLVVIVLDRPRHEQLDCGHSRTGARIRLIGDGDLSAGIAAAVVGTGVHAVMGTGGAPEGVLTAAAMRCLNGEIFARLVVAKPEHEGAVPRDGHQGFKKVYRRKDLAPGKQHHLRRHRRHRRRR